ncbi:MAG TPA: hypothetical protein VNF49_01635 [Candidatus Binataceae bacterium]|nr:hypothetical protein [Candidatus Binataceae bacterium]
MTVEGAIHASSVVLGSEFVELPLKIDRIPEERVVEIFAPDGPDQSIHEWVRESSQLHVS